MAAPGIRSKGENSLNPFRKRARSQAVTGLHLTPRVLATATLDDQKGRKPRLLAARCTTLSGDDDLERVVQRASPGRRSAINLVLADGHLRSVAGRSARR